MTELELRKGITFQGPEGAKVEPAMGADSQVGRIRGAGFVCRYDIGLAANPLTNLNDAQTEEMILAGRPARIIAQGNEKDGLHVMQVAKSVLGDVSMTLTCTSETAEARQKVQQMLRTLRIDEDV